MLSVALPGGTAPENPSISVQHCPVQSVAQQAVSYQTRGILRTKYGRSIKVLIECNFGFDGRILFTMGISFEIGHVVRIAWTFWKVER